MRIKYPARPRGSKFIQPLEEAVKKNRAKLLDGKPISIHLAKYSKAPGWSGNVQCVIKSTDTRSFDSDWNRTGESGFPRRIRVTAYALYSQGCYGKFQISHNRDSQTITIQPVEASQRQ